MALEQDEQPIPALSVSSEDGQELPKCTVKFQCGLLREVETFIGYDVDILCTDTVLEYVCDMLNFKVRLLFNNIYYIIVLFFKY